MEQLEKELKLNHSLKSLLRVCGVGAAIASAAFLATPAAPRAQMTDGIAAVVNDTPISTYDVLQRINLIVASSGVQPSPETIPRLQAQVLRNLVDELIQLQEAERLGVEVAQEEIDAQMARIGASNGLTATDISSVLSEQGIDPAALRDQIRAEIVWNRIVNGRFGSRVRIGDEQINQVLDRMARDAQRDQFLVSEIFLPVDSPELAEDIYNGGVQLIAQMQQGAPFDAVARQFSAAPSAAVGGDLGWVAEGELSAEVTRVLSEMQSGQVSAPVPSSGGFYILALRDRRSAPKDVTQVISLMQAVTALPPEAGPADQAEARARLDDFADRVGGCSDFQAAADRFDDVVAADLGAMELSELSPEFRETAVGLGIEELSEPVRSSAGLHMLIVCERSGANGVAMPSRDQVEDRLYNQQISMLSRRYLRDLRRDSTVEFR